MDGNTDRDSQRLLATLLALQWLKLPKHFKSKDELVLGRLLARASGAVLSPASRSFSTQISSASEQGFNVARRALCWSKTARRWSRAKVIWEMSA